MAFLAVSIKIFLKICSFGFLCIVDIFSYMLFCCLELQHCIILFILFFGCQSTVFLLPFYVLAFAYYKVQTFGFGFLCSYFWMLIMTNTAWSMMETGGGPSIDFLSNSSLIFLIPASDFFPPSTILFLVGVGEEGRVLWVHKIDLSSGSLCFLFFDISFHFQVIVSLTIYVDSLGGSPW